MTIVLNSLCLAATCKAYSRQSLSLYLKKTKIILPTVMNRFAWTWEQFVKALECNSG